MFSPCKEATTPVKNVVVLGGCINNQRPSDKSHGCDCFQVSFVVSHNMAAHRITLCREWVRYMAGALSLRTNTQDAWGEVIRECVREHFGTGDNSMPVRASWIKSSKVRKVCEPLGYMPDHFVECVMANRYGTLCHPIPLAEMAEYVFGEESAMNNPYQYHVKSSSTEYKIMDYNYAEFIKFKKVLHRIMNDTDLRRRIGILSSKKEGTYHENTPSLYAALHLQLMAIEAKKQALEENTNPKHSTTL